VALWCSSTWLTPASRARACAVATSRDPMPRPRSWEWTCGTPRYAVVPAGRRTRAASTLSARGALGTTPGREPFPFRVSAATPVECSEVVSQLDSPTRSDGPVRTCIGCRARAAKRELLRVVARTDASDQDGSWYVVPDPSGTAPGRGAHLHPTPECLALAERRRAFARALRHDAGGPGRRWALSLERLREHLAQTDQDTK
jgi:predicted RNA-binding protein YlxR (DUF448 family)